MFKVFGPRYVYLVVGVVNLIGFIGGTLITWTSPVLTKLVENGTDNPIGRKITENEQSWIGSLSSIGGIFGPLVFAFIFEHFGRKLGSIAVLVPAVASYLIAAFGKTVAAFYVSRFLGGIVVASGLSLTPMYVGEISNKHNRGTLLTSVSIFITSGALFSYAVGSYTSIMVFNIILSVFPVSVIVGIFFLVPESPYFLVHKNKNDKAIESLVILRGTTQTEAKKQVEEIHNDVSKIRKDGFIDIFKTRAGTKAFFIVTPLIILQQCTGTSIISSYTHLIFMETGTSNADIFSILVGATQLVAIIVTTFIVDKVGRKPLFYYSTIGVILSLFTIGLFFYLKDEHGTDYIQNITWLPLVAFMSYTLFFNLGLGSLTWTILGELYPLNVKSAGSSIASSVYSIVGFLLNYFYSRVSDSIGNGETFWMFTAVACIILVFVRFFVIETKGRSLQEIQDILAK